MQQQTLVIHGQIVAVHLKAIDQPAGISEMLSIPMSIGFLLKRLGEMVWPTAIEVPNLIEITILGRADKGLWILDFDGVAEPERTARFRTALMDMSETRMAYQMTKRGKPAAFYPFKHELFIEGLTEAVAQILIGQDGEKATCPLCGEDPDCPLNNAIMVALGLDHPELNDVQAAMVELEAVYGKEKTWTVDASAGNYVKHIACAFIWRDGAAAHCAAHGKESRCAVNLAIAEELARPS